MEYKRVSNRGFLRGTEERVNRRFLFSFYVLAAILLFVLRIDVKAGTIVDSGSCGESVNWELDDEGTLTISGTGDMADYTEEDKSPWYATYVKDYMNTDNGAITNVVIGDGVTSIGDYSFYNCQHLTGITVANSVRRIGKKSFAGCSRLPGISLPKITVLGDYAFDSCTSLTTYTSNDWGLTFGSYVFNNCTSLTNVTFGSSYIYNVDYTLFWGCSSLKSVRFSYEYYYGEFRNGVYSGITAQKLGNQKGVYVSRYIVAGMGTEEEEFTSGEYFYEIGPYCFYNCDNLKRLNLGEAMETIGDNAFRNCDNIQELTLGRRVETIGENAFAECGKITSVTFPGCVSEIGKNAFAECDSLETVYFRGDSPQTDGSIFSSDQAITAYYPEDNDTWTQEVKSMYDGNITWVAYSPELSEFSDTYYIAELEETSFVYDGEEIKPAVKSVGKRKNNTNEYYPYWLTSGVNYIADYEDNILSGTARALIRGHGEYEGTIVKTFNIKPLVTVAEVSGYYDGKSKSLDIRAEGDATLYFSTVTPLTYENYLEEGTTTLPSRTSAGSTTVYYIAIPDNNPTEASAATGECQLVIEKGDQKLTADINSSKVYIGETAQITASSKGGNISYNSNNPDIASVDENGIVEGISEGKARITVTAEETANYQSQQKVIEVTVSPHLEISILDCSIEVESGLTYTGGPVEAEVSVEYEGSPLVEYRDYTLSYNNNTNAGIATVTVSGKGDYVGIVVKNFVIVKAPQILNVNVTSTTVKVGSTVNLTLADETQGAVTYASGDKSIATVSRTGVVTGVSEGTVDITVTATETDNYLQSEKTITFNIVGETTAKNINDCEVTLSQSSYVYDGNTKKPGVTVKDGGNTLRETEDYTITYPSNTTDAGTYTVTVAGAGSYTGEKELSYEILQADPELSFAEESITRKVGDEPFINVLEKTTDGTISYSIDKENVATIDAISGEVEIIGEGTATITAASSKGKNYRAGSASYELIVNKAAVRKLTISDLSYSFENNRYSFGYDEDYHIPLDRFQYIFGNTTKAKLFYANKSEGKKWGGNCAGFSGTAALFNDRASGVTVKDFNPAATSVGELLPGNESAKHDMTITSLIEAMQVSQYTKLFKDEISDHRIYTKQHLLTGKSNLNNIYQAVKAETGEGRPVLLALYQDNMGHAVLAYDIKEVSDTESQILLYDNNYPMGQRALTLRKNSAGNYIGWSYQIGSTVGTWSSDVSNSSISYVCYDVIRTIWDTRGDLEENVNIVSVNSQSMAIYETNGSSPIATVTQGTLTSENEKIQVVDDLSMERDDSENLLISLPVDGYTFVNLDKDIKDFEVSMTNNNLGATVTTTAEGVTLAVDDSCNLNAVYIDAGEDDTYSVTLNSTFSYDNDNIVVTGNGSGDTMEISQSKGNITFNNCQFASFSIGGNDVDMYQINASAGAGGKIDPKGANLLLKGESLKYRITADEGYQISDVKIDGKSVGPVSSYTFENVTSDHEIIAYFKKIQSEQTTGQKNPITAKDMTVTSASKAKKYKLKAAADDGAVLSYKSNSKYVKISGDGTITVAKNFVGRAVITVKAAATKKYEAATKKVTITVIPTGTAFRQLKAVKGGKLNVTWKKNSKVTGYQISYSTASGFAGAKTVTVKKARVVKAVIRKLKKRKYYIRIRTYKTVSGKKFYSVWSKKRAVKAR